MMNNQVTGCDNSKNPEDQSSAAKVEELAEMERIDRELHSSLDPREVLRTALKWAVHRLNADCGLAGLLVDGDVKVVASQGYSDELAQFEENLIPAGFLSLERLAEAGIPGSIELRAGESPRLLVSARRQTLAPMGCEPSMMGVILLEHTSAQPPPAPALDFLTRLGDHCAAALSNAQLHTAALAALEAKNDFISFILHELKNPITSISGYADLLAGGSVGAVTEIQAKYLNTIRANAARLFTLVSDLMDLSRIEEGQMRLDFGSVELGDIIAEVVVSLQPQLDEKHQLLEHNLPDGLPLVRTDRKRLYQVLTNLVNNAQKFTPQDGRIMISAEATTNQWDERGAPRVVHVRVQDNGIGIRPEDVGEVFKKFYRAEDPLVQRIPGTGLGLHITKYLVEALGGRIWFESEYQQGTTFHITIPVAG